MTDALPTPTLTRVYRLEATLGAPLDLGQIPQGQRRIVPLTGGTFTGPQLGGQLLAGASADWQVILADGTALGDIRYTLRTDDGELLYVQSRGIRHGSADVLARLGRGEPVDPSEYTFRTATQIESPHRGSTGSTRAFSSASPAASPPGHLRGLPRRLKPQCRAQNAQHAVVASSRRRERRHSVRAVSSRTPAGRTRRITRM